MYYIIYKITNIFNNKIYIGKHQTTNVNDSYFGSGKLVKRAIEKHGKENFTKEILFIFDTEEEMNAKERELVTEDFCLLEDNYNLCAGGFGGFSYINRKGLNQTPLKRGSSNLNDFYKIKYNTDPIFRAQMDEKNYIKLARYREANGGGFKGKQHSEETKLKMSEQKKISSRGERNSQFGTCWITNGKQNKKHLKTEPVPIGWSLGRKLKDIT